MSKFFEFQPDIFGQFVPKMADLYLPEGISFTSGAIIRELPLPLPLIFFTGHSMQKKPKHLYEDNNSIIIMSDELIASLESVGVTNLQTFPAELRSKKDGTIWTNYRAVNVLGLVSCANLKTSEHTHIMAGPDNVPLLAFETIKVDPVRAADALFFRLAESPGTIIAAKKVVDFLLTRHTDDEWGITLDKR